MPFSTRALATTGLLVLTLLASDAIRAEAQSAAPPDANGTLTVNVVQGLGDQAVAGANLQWVVAAGRPHLTGNWTTDQTGRSTLTYTTSTESELKFWTIADGFVPVETVVQRDLTGALPSSCTVRLERAASVGGVVLNEAGAPVAAVEVFLELGTNAAVRDNFHYEKTDAKGRWTCHHAPRQLHAVRFRSIHPDYVTVLFAPDTTEWKEESAARVSEADLLSSRAAVIMKRGLPLNGLVLDSNQRPIEGAEVSGGDYPVWTPADGRFSFNNCPPGPTVLTAQARGFAPQRKQIFVRDRMDEARFILEPGHTLKVRVLDTKGRPVPGARIASETWQEKGAGQWQWETDAQGRLVWDSAPAEEAFYSISRLGYEAVSSQPLKADGEEHVITLHKLLHITGHVVDSETRAPVAAFRVVPGVLHVDHHDWNQALAINALNGMYAMELPKQDMRHFVRVEAEGYYPEISRTFLDEEEDAVADFALKRGATISGRETK